MNWIPAFSGMTLNTLRFFSAFNRHYKKYVKKINYFNVKNDFRGGEELKTFS